ncbi:MAG: hypothetical protein OXS29_00700 [bacterium]|nr:hypothetical protein [bacterium]MDE0437435.1 hypothetical protein [bacterium]
MSFWLVKRRSGPVVPYSEVYSEGGEWIGSVAREGDPPVWVPVNGWGDNLRLGGSGETYETLDDAVGALQVDHRQGRDGYRRLVERVLTFGPVEDYDGSGTLTQTVWAPAVGFEGEPFGDLGYLGRIELCGRDRFRAVGETPPTISYGSLEPGSLGAVCCDLLRLRHLRDAGRWAPPSGWAPPGYTYEPADVLGAAGFLVWDGNRRVGFGWEHSGEWKVFGISRLLGSGACEFSSSREVLSHNLSLYTHYDQWVETEGLASPLREEHFWEYPDYCRVFSGDTFVGTVLMKPASVTVEAADGRCWSLTTEDEEDESVRNLHALQRLAHYHHPLSLPTRWGD